MEKKTKRSALNIHRLWRTGFILLLFISFTLFVRIYQPLYSFLSRTYRERTCDADISLDGKREANGISVSLTPVMLDIKSPMAHRTAPLQEANIFFTVKNESPGMEMCVSVRFTVPNGATTAKEMQMVDGLPVAFEKKAEALAPELKLTSFRFPSGQNIKADSVILSEDGNEAVYEFRYLTHQEDYLDFDFTFRPTAQGRNHVLNMDIAEMDCDITITPGRLACGRKAF